jgi:hypothetical protein
MPYTEEDEFDIDYEAAEGWVDDGSDESVGEARPKILHQRYRPNGRRVPPPPSRQVTGLQGGAISTPAGRAQFRFEKPVATKESVDGLARELRAAIARVDQAVEKNTSVLDKKIAAIDKNTVKGAEQNQLSMLLPLLLTTPPQIEKVKLGDPVPGYGPNIEIPVQTTTYKQQDNLLLLLLLFGGLGGGNGDSSSMLILALALSGGLGGSKP